MKRKMTLILIVLAVVLVGCVTRTGVPLTDFDKVEIRSGFTVDISVGKTIPGNFPNIFTKEYSVVLKVTEDVLEHVEAVKSGDTLIIRAKSGHDTRGAALRAEVAMPALTGLTLNDGSHVTVSGSGDDVTISVKGGSHANLANFAVENADLTASDGSHVTLNVSGRLDVEVSGGSHVLYSGEPQIGDIDLSGGSTFRKK